MVAAATTVAIFTADQWAQRLLQVYPGKWTSDSAKVAGGILYSLFSAQSSQYNFLQNGLEWVLTACRIATAQDVALDAIATDYFGSVAQFEAIVVRQPGETDNSFRAQIYANLLQTGGTRADIIRVCQLLTGQSPRVCEPWNVLDTNACDANSYFDIDTPANPCRVADLNAPYTGFVDSILPTFGDQGNNPVWCLDYGLAFDRSFIIDPQPTWFLGEHELDQAINRVRMFATLVGRRYDLNPVANYARGNNSFPSAGTPTVSIILSPPCLQPLVVLACAMWNSQVSVRIIDNGDFVLSLGTLAPGGQSVDFIAAPATLPGFGLLHMNAGDIVASLAIPIPGQKLLVTPSWNTTVWLTAQESSSASFGFSTPAPPGAVLNYGCFAPSNSGTVLVSAGSPSAPATFAAPINHAYQLILLPSWDTEFIVTKNSTGFLATFAIPPAVDSFFSWGVLNQPY